MNRPRRDDECYRCYRRHLREEAIEHKNRLKPRVVWTSVILVPDAKDKELPEYLRPLVQMKVRGTFDRSLGHRMPNSLSEKHRRERMLKKLRRNGVIPNEAR